ncbi:sensor domain-containing diguanylate cyclase [Salibacterium qingdaonense]|uniref:Diguanylate cyclase (GGDEF) domain-containing protein n=1 Tax=Salibacterium qingdaonense TaxID=266892 RepID=A0A1I4NLQ8_9BACI|nr:sensor domain-containing diguanylate cyclase [Salibacterium qingdaonense]SFM16438.1 diguanylate cyclase (GGDEF) domain-containing protein [Salibacterium qingdaonense]
MKNVQFSSDDTEQYKWMWEEILDTKEVRDLFGSFIFFLKNDHGETVSTYTDANLPEGTEICQEEKLFQLEGRFWTAGAIVKQSHPNSTGLVFFLSGLIPFLKHRLQEQYRNGPGRDKRYALMVQVTKKFHSSMKAAAVLKEIVQALEFIYPGSRIALHLAQDWEVHSELGHIDCSFGFQNINEKMKQTYLLGQIQTAETKKEENSVLYIPLLGKQGVYGVLAMEAGRQLVEDEMERDYIKTLADTGGSALENAELYQQSRTLIKDLQLINETSQFLNSTRKFEETVDSMQLQIEKFIPDSRQGYILMDDVRNVRMLNDEYFQAPERMETIFRVMDHFERNHEAVFIGDLLNESSYDFDGFRSMMAVPMKQSDELKGAVIVLGRETKTFTFHQFKLLQSLVHHSTLAFMNAVLHEKLEKLIITDHLTKLHSRSYLEQKMNESLHKEKRGTFLLFDIDNFKEINDNFGHQTGDSIIVQVGEILEQNIRSEDTAARWGGEELAVYLPDTSLEEGRKVADRIVRHVEHASSPSVTISCGASSWMSGEYITLDNLFFSADQALYRAKRKGKNQVMYEI